MIHTKINVRLGGVVVLLEMPRNTPFKKRVSINYNKLFAVCENADHYRQSFKILDIEE